MNQQVAQQSNYIPAIGEGYLHFQRSDTDMQTKAEVKAVAAGKPAPVVAVWQGDITAPSGKTFQLRGLAATRAKDWKFTLNYLPSSAPKPELAWKPMVEFTMPKLNGQTYVDGEIPIDGKKVAIRMIFLPEEGHFLVRLPEYYRPRKHAELRKRRAEAARNYAM